MLLISAKLRGRLLVPSPRKAPYSRPWGNTWATLGTSGCKRVLLVWCRVRSLGCIILRLSELISKNFNLDFDCEVFVFIGIFFQLLRVYFTLKFIEHNRINTWKVVAPPVLLRAPIAGSPSVASNFVSYLLDSSFFHLISFVHLSTSCPSSWALIFGFVAQTDPTSCVFWLCMAKILETNLMYIESDINEIQSRELLSLNASAALLTQTTGGHFAYIMLPLDATPRAPFVFQCGIHYNTVPCVLLGLAGLRFSEALENHFLTSHTPFPSHLLPVENSADPSLQFRCSDLSKFRPGCAAKTRARKNFTLTELVPHQISPQHSVLSISVQDGQSGVSVLAMKVRVPPWCRAGAQVITKSF